MERLWRSICSSCAYNFKFLRCAPGYKAIATLLEKILAQIIHQCPDGDIKGRYLGECIRIISDIMSFAKQKNVRGSAVFVDSEKAFDSIEWNYLQKYLEVLRFGPELRQWIKVVYNDISSSVLNNCYASEHFSLSRGGIWNFFCYNSGIEYPVFPGF